MEIQKPSVVLIVLAIIFGIMACFAGAASGLYFAWVIAPVQWVDMTPYALDNMYQEDYLRMVIDSYALNADCERAIQRYQALGENGPVTLEVIFDNSHPQDAEAIAAFAQCIKE